MPAPLPPIRPAPTSITAFVGQAHSGPFNRPVQIGSVAEFGRVFGTLQQDDPLGLALRLYLANGGEHALVVRVRDPEAIADPALESRQEGLWALDRADPFNLLCVPPPSL